MKKKIIIPLALMLVFLLTACQESTSVRMRTMGNRRFPLPVLWQETSIQERKPLPRYLNAAVFTTSTKGENSKSEMLHVFALDLARENLESGQDEPGKNRIKKVLEDVFGAKGPFREESRKSGSEQVLLLSENVAADRDRPGWIASYQESSDGFCYLVVLSGKGNITPEDRSLVQRIMTNSQDRTPEDACPG